MIVSLCEKQNKSIHKVWTIKFAYVIREWVIDEEICDQVSIYVYNLPDQISVGSIKGKYMYKTIDV